MTIPHLANPARRLRRTFRHRRIRHTALVFICTMATTLSVTACSTSSSSNTDPGSDSSVAKTQTITLLAYDSFTPAEGIFDAFTQATGATVEVVTGGDTGTLVSKAILTAGNPEGDVLWGIDNTFLSRAQDAKVLESYEPVDEGDICINYDKKWFADKNLAVPETLEDLTNPDYKNLLVVQDPVSSSPGLGFLMATVATFGNDWPQFWQRLRANGVKIVPDWTTAYTVEFSGSSGKGSRPLVVSYGSSPPAEVIFSSTPIDEAPTGVMTASCFRQTEYVGVLRGTDSPELAQQLVEYLLDVPFQESLPLSLFVYPVNPQATLPEEFAKWAVRPDAPLTISPEEIARNREQWIDQWRRVAL